MVDLYHNYQLNRNELISGRRWHILCTAVEVLTGHCPNVTLAPFSLLPSL
jgi:hypothetical protein